MSMVMTSAAGVFPEKYGLSSYYGSQSSCNCCPYGYHIDLDFVRYCEELANANPSENEMQRRHNRRSRKSMDFMLGLENLTLDEWDHQIREAGEGNLVTSSPLATLDLNTLTSSSSARRPRSASVPRFTFNSSGTRPESPFGTTSSTCSSMMGAESDVPFSLYQRRQRKSQHQPSADTHAFLRDALDDVCSDFERTLERASVRRKKNTVRLFEGGVKTNTVGGFDDKTSNTNYYRQKNLSSHEKNTFSKWERQYDFLDSCVGGNKSPRSSRILSRSNTLPYIVQQKPTEAEQKYELYVKANVAANSTCPVDEQVEHLLTGHSAPPPPPRRHTQHRRCSPLVQNHEIENAKPVQNIENGRMAKETSSTADAQTLHNIRQQMALSLSRMRDLEEQVKTIPVLKLELQQVREEKRRLELNRTTIRETPSPKMASPVQFSPQHINSISLDNLGARLRTSSTSSSSERKLRTVMMKRDVGTNCNRPAKRDVGVGSPVLSTRSVSTEPEQKLSMGDQLFTQWQMEECVRNALKKHKEQRLLNTTTKSTQIAKPTNEACHSSTQTVQPADTRDNAVMCKPNVRSIGSSDHRITDTVCDKCTVKKRHIACGTNDDETSTKYSVSLKTLDTPYLRSNTFSLGEQERLNLLVRKSVGTQYVPQTLVDAFSQTASKRLQSVGVQSSSVSQNSSHTQTHNEQLTRGTDTKDLIKLSIRETSNEDIEGEPKKAVISHSKACNTELVRTRDRGENTTPIAKVCHAGSNTEKVAKRDVGCGDIVKPHISIACAENYCDSCKDTIKHLAKDFSKGQPPSPLSPVASRANESRIPRPKHLSSPSPVRKQIYRQNTYTITPSPTPSPVAEKKIMSKSLSSSSSFLKQRSTSEIKSSELYKRLGRKPSISKSSEIVDTKTKPQSDAKQHQKDAADLSLDEPLIVREEKRVSICWSRENSPLPPQNESSDTKSLQVSANDETTSQSMPTDVTATSQESSDSQTTHEIYTPTSAVRSAMKILNDSLLKKMSAKSLTSSNLQSAKSTVQKEWFHISSAEQAKPTDVLSFLNYVEKFSLQLLEHCVNLRDNNGNTALHYAVSHGSFDIVSVLLDSKVCDVNQMNNAGYTCVMLVSLAKLKDSSHRAVVERLFSMADINIRAKKHCQTALMLAVSHGNIDMVQMLLAAGAAINAQDEDGSTALMCAAEHGRIDIVKHLLSHSDCDSLIQDVDCSTAFKIAWQGGYRDIGLLLYVHEQMLRSKLPHRSEQQQKTPTLLPSNADKQNSAPK